MDDDEQDCVEQGYVLVPVTLQSMFAGDSAPTVEATDWPQIVALYDQLFEVTPTPVVALNRAIAICEVRDSAVALSLVDELDLDSYHLFHATRADCFGRLGRHSEAEIVRACSRSGADGRRAGIPKTRGPSLTLSA